MSLVLTEKVSAAAAVVVMGVDYQKIFEEPAAENHVYF
jgi:hypothetical protein